jgi:hypothetical protein
VEYIDNVLCFVKNSETRVWLEVDLSDALEGYDLLAQVQKL